MARVRTRQRPIDSQTSLRGEAMYDREQRGIYADYLEETNDPRAPFWRYCYTKPAAPQEWTGMYGHDRKGNYVPLDSTFGWARDLTDGRPGVSYHPQMELSVKNSGALLPGDVWRVMECGRIRTGVWWKRYKTIKEAWERAEAAWLKTRIEEE